MKTKSGSKVRLLLTGGLCVSLAVAVAFLRPPSNAFGNPPSWYYQTFCGYGEEPPNCDVGGSWYWLRSPEQEKRVVMALFNRYCIRCHGVDGRGVWDIPDVPNFANPRWQASRSDGELARAILEGRGSVMPPWRGTVSLEEAWAIARYVRTFVPGTEMSRPDYGAPPMQAPAIPPVPPPRMPPAKMPPAKMPPAPAPIPRSGRIDSFAPQMLGPSPQQTMPLSVPPTS
jgi:hypothetical protein